VTPYHSPSRIVRVLDWFADTSEMGGDLCWLAGDTVMRTPVIGLVLFIVLGVVLLPLGLVSRLVRWIAQ
jgi:hypothetical protein